MSEVLAHWQWHSIHQLCCSVEQQQDRCLANQLLHELTASIIKKCLRSWSAVSSISIDPNTALVWVVNKCTGGALWSLVIFRSNAIELIVDVDCVLSLVIWYNICIQLLNMYMFPLLFTMGNWNQYKYIEVTGSVADYIERFCFCCNYRFKLLPKQYKGYRYTRRYFLWRTSCLLFWIPVLSWKGAYYIRTEFSAQQENSFIKGGKNICKITASTCKCLDPLQNTYFVQRNPWLKFSVDADYRHMFTC